MDEDRYDRQCKEREAAALARMTTTERSNHERIVAQLLSLPGRRPRLEPPSIEIVTRRKAIVINEDNGYLIKISK